MELLDGLRVVLRWAHAIASVAWVGGSFFYLWVLRPALAFSEAREMRQAVEQRVNRGFQELVDACIMILVVSGVLLSFDRLAQGPISGAYVVLLGLKITAAMWMFYLARQLRSGRAGSARTVGVAPSAVMESRPSGRGAMFVLQELKGVFSPSRLVLGLGLVIVLLAILLRAVYEGGLRAF